MLPCLKKKGGGEKKRKKTSSHGQQIIDCSLKNILTNGFPEEQLYYAKNTVEIN